MVAVSTKCPACGAYATVLYGDKVQCACGERFEASANCKATSVNGVEMAHIETSSRQLEAHRVLNKAMADAAGQVSWIEVLAMLSIMAGRASVFVTHDGATREEVDATCQANWSKGVNEGFTLLSEAMDRIKEEKH